mmetsp:Transcript_13855/g.28598  ORF Transcript_13855/g.28598 Transcript_13855/m.28598 type:complete len:341 (-) Transcript_13855:36-1058(-)
MSTCAEWRSFADDDGPSPNRVGAAAAADESVASTFVAGGGRSASRLVQAQMRSVDKKKSAAQDELLRLVGELCTHMDLTGPIPQAARHTVSTFLAARENSVLNKKKFSKPVLAAACVYAACSKVGLHRTVKEMQAGCHCDQKKFNSAVKHVQELVKHVQELSVPAAASHTVALILLPRFCANLCLPFSLENAATAALSSAPYAFTSRHVPASLAAAAIARVSGRTAGEVAKATGAAASTITKLVREWRRLCCTGSGGQAQSDAPVVVATVPVPAPAPPLKPPATEAEHEAKAEPAVVQKCDEEAVPVPAGELGEGNWFADDSESPSTDWDVSGLWSQHCQ